MRSYERRTETKNMVFKQGTEEQVDNKDANFGTAAELTLLK